MPPKPRDPFNFDEFFVAAGAGNFVKRPMAEHVTKGAPTEKINDAPVIPGTTAEYKLPADSFDSFGHDNSSAREAHVSQVSSPDPFLQNTLNVCNNGDPFSMFGDVPGAHLPSYPAPASITQVHSDDFLSLTPGPMPSSLVTAAAQLPAPLDLLSSSGSATLGMQQPHCQHVVGGPAAFTSPREPSTAHPLPLSPEAPQAAPSPLPSSHRNMGLSTLPPQSVNGVPSPGTASMDAMPQHHPATRPQYRSHQQQLPVSYAPGSGYAAVLPSSPHSAPLGSCLGTRSSSSRSANSSSGGAEEQGGRSSSSHHHHHHSNGTQPSPRAQHRNPAPAAKAASSVVGLLKGFGHKAVQAAQVGLQHLEAALEKLETQADIKQDKVDRPARPSAASTAASKPGNLLRHSAGHTRLVTHHLQPASDHGPPDSCAVPSDAWGEGAGRQLEEPHVIAVTLMALPESERLPVLNTLPLVVQQQVADLMSRQAAAEQEAQEEAALAQLPPLSVDVRTHGFDVSQFRPATASSLRHNTPPQPLLSPMQPLLHASAQPSPTSRPGNRPLSAPLAPEAGRGSAGERGGAGQQVGRGVSSALPVNGPQAADILGFPDHLAASNANHLLSPSDDSDHLISSRPAGTQLPPSSSRAFVGFEEDSDLSFPTPSAAGPTGRTQLASPAGQAPDLLASFHSHDSSPLPPPQQQAAVEDLLGSGFCASMPAPPSASPAPPAAAAVAYPSQAASTPVVDVDEVHDFFNAGPARFTPPGSSSSAAAAGERQGGPAAPPPSGAHPPISAAAADLLFYDEGGSSSSTRSAPAAYSMPGHGRSSGSRAQGGRARGGAGGGPSHLAMDLSDMLGGEHHPSQGQAAELYYSDEGCEGEPEVRRRLREARVAEKHAKMRAALADKQAKDAEEARRREQQVELKAVHKATVDAWRNRNKNNIRGLLSSLHTVLWEGSGWQPVSMADLLDPAHIRKVWMRANLLVHPDKVRQRDGSPEQVAIADMVFDALKEAWNGFQATGRQG